MSIHVTKKVKPPPDQFQDVIEAGGGVYLPAAPKTAGEGVVVVSCPEDKSTHAKFSKAGIPVLDKEFILTGLLKYKLDYANVSQ